MSLIQSLTNSKNIRQDLLDLRNTMTQQQKEQIIINDSFFLDLLANDDSKIRKVACEILAKTEDKKYKNILFDAYKNETQQMIRSSLLKAVGTYDLKEELDYLENQESILVEALNGENAKHAKEELRVLRRILQTYRTLQKHTFIGFKNDVPIILTMPAGHHEALMDELVGFETKKVGLGVQVKTNKIQQLLECRLFGNMYFPVCKTEDMSVSSLTDGTIIQKVLRFLDRCHEENGPYRFRLDMEEASLSREIAQTLERNSQGRLQNYPGDYEIEIRIRENTKKEGVVYLKLLTIEDHRFNYRKQTSSSSLACHTAALIAHYLQDYVKADGQLLDPMCNDGTLLIERALALPPHFVIGLDFNADLMNKAKQNANEAYVDIRFVQRDIKTFNHQRLFDEVITQLPSIRFKEDSDATEKLYTMLFNKVRDLMEVGGIFAVYAKESALVQKAYNKNRSYLSLKRRIPMIGKHELYIYEVLDTYNKERAFKK